MKELQSDLTNLNDEFYLIITKPEERFYFEKIVKELIKSTAHLNMQSKNKNNNNILIGQILGWKVIDLSDGHIIDFSSLFSI